MRGEEKDTGTFIHAGAYRHKALSDDEKSLNLLKSSQFLEASTYG